MTEHLSSLALHRIAAGEVAADVRGHLAGCGACQGRFATVDEAHRRFAAEVDVPARAAEIARAVRRPRRTWIAAGCALGAAAVVLLAVRVRDDAQIDGRRKGGATLAVVRRTPAGDVAPVGWGDVLHPGDAIRFRVTATGYMAVLGIDAAQAVTAYAPVGAQTERVTGTVLLDGSIILDDTLGAERIVLAVCDEPREVGALVDEARGALARAGGDPLRIAAATTCREDALVIHKEKR